MIKDSTTLLFDFNYPKEDDQTGYMIRINEKKNDKFVEYANLETRILSMNGGYNNGKLDTLKH